METCDDGNQLNNDACVMCKPAKCGDGFAQMGVEECDDGNINNNDGCSATCKKEAVVTNFQCTKAPVNFVVPQGITKIKIEAWGAQGGTAQFSINNCGGAPDIGGNGGYATGELTVVPGETLQINVGCKGGQANAPGWNGGGNGCGEVNTCSGGGGGSDVRKGGVALGNRVIVAGGGGGAEYSCGNQGGGAGGGLVGNPALGSDAGVAGDGKGGTQAAGGAPGNGAQAGSLGQGGNGSLQLHSGGGGGGYYGGGGGSIDGSAGGGSSYIGGVANASTQTGLKTGDGQIILSY